MADCQKAEEERKKQGRKSCLNKRQDGIWKDNIEEEIKGDQSSTRTGTKSHRDRKGAKASKVRVGWVNATGREKKLVIRCFKCLEFGYFAAECLKDITENLCYKCGDPGHLAAGCGMPYKCLDCKATGKPHGHKTMDVTCAALRIARGKLDHHQNRNG